MDINELERKVKDLENNFQSHRHLGGLNDGLPLNKALTGQAQGQRVGYYKGATDGSGNATVTPADLGLTTIVRAIVVCPHLDVNHQANGDISGANVAVATWTNANIKTGGIAFVVLAIGT